MATAYHADGTKTRSKPPTQRELDIESNWKGLVPPHRPYQGGKVLVDLTADVAVRAGRQERHVAFNVTHTKGTRLWARAINRNPDGTTRLHYAKNDSKHPGVIVPAVRSQFMLAQYSFVDCDFDVLVRDDTVYAHSWGFGCEITIRVVHRTLGMECSGYVRHEDTLKGGGWSPPRVSLGGVSMTTVENALAKIRTNTYLVDLLQAEFAYRMSLPGAKLACWAKKKPRKKKR